MGVVNMDGVTVSIIIPSYNAESTIRACLDSVAAQNFFAYEVLIIDGQSTDRTVDIANSYAGNIKTLTLISEKDQGIYDAMNKGIRLAKGEWLYFLGADDSLYEEHVLQRIFSGQSLMGKIMVYGKALVFPKQTITPIGMSFNDLVRFNICHQAIFYHRRVFERWSYDLRYPTLADWDLNLKIFAKFSSRIVDLDLIVCRFLNKGVSSNWKASTEFKNHFSDPFRVYARYQPFYKFPGAIIPLLRMGFSKVIRKLRSFR